MVYVVTPLEDICLDTLNSDGGPMNTFDDITSRMTNVGENIFKFEFSLNFTTSINTYFIVYIMKIIYL